MKPSIYYFDYYIKKILKENIFNNFFLILLTYNKKISLALFSLQNFPISYTNILNNSITIIISMKGNIVSLKLIIVKL